MTPVRKGVRRRRTTPGVISEQPFKFSDRPDLHDLLDGDGNSITIPGKCPHNLSTPIIAHIIRLILVGKLTLNYNDIPLCSRPEGLRLLPRPVRLTQPLHGLPGTSSPLEPDVVRRGVPDTIPWGPWMASHSVRPGPTQVPLRTQEVGSGRTPHVRPRRG